MFTTRYRLRRWRRDLNLFISELCRNVGGKARMWDSKKPNALDTVKLEPKNLNRFPANPHRAGAGRCRIRQREKSPLHSSATRSAKCYPRQAWKENLARARSAC